MIRINRQSKPAILVEKELEWTTEYASYLADKDSVPKAAADRYTHAEIKAAIRSDAWDKCAYCEAKVTDVYVGETDHILPIAHCPELVVAWTNLAFVCRQCNHPKSSYFNPALPLVDPYAEAPENHIAFYGPMPIQWTDRGRKTINQLKLKRTALVERRMDRLQSVQDLIELWESKANNSAAQDALKLAIIEECQPDKEFSATVRCYIRCRMGWPV